MKIFPAFLCCLFRFRILYDNKDGGQTTFSVSKIVLKTVLLLLDKMSNDSESKYE